MLLDINVYILRSSSWSVCFGFYYFLSVQVRRAVLSDYEWVQAGWAFSMKAFMPSFWSLVANVLWNTRRSKCTPARRAQVMKV